MPFFAPPRRILLLAVALLSACGAAGQTPPSSANAAPLQAREVTSPFGAYLAGRLAQSETDTAVAADLLLEALRRDPDQPELATRAFVAALLDGRPEALRLARRLPENQAAQLLLIGAEAQAGRWDRTETRIRALPRTGPGGFLQPFLLAWAQQGRGQTDAALATLRPLSESGRLRGIHALHMALIADLAGRPRDAERAIRTAIAETPEPSLRFVQLSAGILARAGREEDALRLLESVGRGLSDYALFAITETQRRAVLTTRNLSSPVEGMAEAHLALAAALASQPAPPPRAGQPPAANNDGALILARLALRLRPGFAPTLLLMAEQYAEERHYQTAYALLEQVPADDPLAPVAALRRALLLDRMDRTAEAEAALERLAAEQPQAPQPPARLGDIRRTKSRFPAAVTAYDQALARLGTSTPTAWPLLYARGISHERAGNWPLAEADFQRALALSPEQPYVLNYLAYTWVERGENLVEARRMLERAVELRPNDGNIVDSLGWALFKLGDIPGAIRWLERAVELESRNSVINDHLGDVYWAAGRQLEARFQWRRALTLEPEPEELPKIQAKLRDGLPAPTARRAD